MEYVRLLWHEIDKGYVYLRKADEQIATTPVALLIDAKGVFDSISRSESAALSMNDKRSIVEGLALKESIARTRTKTRWVHSEINVADGLTKFDARACQLLREFRSSPTWRVTRDPTFTSAKKVHVQKVRGMKEITSTSAIDNRLPTGESCLLEDGSQPTSY